METKYTIKELSPNMYEVKVSLWAWSPRPHLVQAILEIQRLGKVVTGVENYSGWSYTYLVFTRDVEASWGLVDEFSKIWELADTLAEKETLQFEKLPYKDMNRTQYKDEGREKHILEMLSILIDQGEIYEE